MKIALCQMDIVWEDKQENIKKAEAFIHQSQQQGASVILFPEMSLTGFSMQTEVTKEKNGETVKCFMEFAKRYETAIGIGWVKEAKEKAENHYTMIDKNGQVISDYIKIHPFSYSGEHEKFNSGNTIVSFNLNGVMFGNFICYDLRFPEIFQISSKKNHVIILPANWPESRREHWRTLLKARAIENQVYIIGINCVGKQRELSYSGDSCVINPNGDVIVEESGTEKLIICKIEDDVETYRSRFPMKKDRQEELYLKNYDCYKAMQSYD